MRLGKYHNDTIEFVFHIFILYSLWTIYLIYYWAYLLSPSFHCYKNQLRIRLIPTNVNLNHKHFSFFSGSLNLSISSQYIFLYDSFLMPARISFFEIWCSIVLFYTDIVKVNDIVESLNAARFASVSIAWPTIVIICHKFYTQKI